MLVALLAVGVITGTIPSFEMGLLWPDFTGTFGSVFGLGFAIEGFAFFIEAIFVAIYVYGWGRLSPRRHFVTGIPVAIAGFAGPLMVISVNAWMNHPSGFRLHAGHAGADHRRRARRRRRAVSVAGAAVRARAARQVRPDGHRRPHGRTSGNGRRRRGPAWPPVPRPRV